MIFFFSIIKSIADFALTYWKQIAIILAVLFVYHLVDKRGYDRAYAERTTYYEKILAGNRQHIVEKLNHLDDLSTNLAVNGQANHNNLVQDLNVLTATLKTKKLFVFKNGECTPSKDFIDNYNSIISRGNSK